MWRNLERQQGIISLYIKSQQLPASFSPPFASDVSHQKTDWVSIHSQICHLLSPVLRPQACFHSEKDRKQGKEELLRKQVGAGGASTAPKGFQGWNSSSSPHPGCPWWNFHGLTWNFQPPWSVQTSLGCCCPIPIKQKGVSCLKPSKALPSQDPPL